MVVHVRDDGVEFGSCLTSKLPSSETTDYLAAARDVSSDPTAVVGPAGEHEVRFASIITTAELAFGRSGLGAVLGTKNVKEVMFGGDSAPEIPVGDVTSEIHARTPPTTTS